MMTRAELANQLRDIAGLLELAGSLTDADRARSLCATQRTLQHLIDRLSDCSGPAPAITHDKKED